MIKISATRTVAAAVLAGGLAVAPLLDKGEQTATPVSEPLPAQAPQFQINWHQGELRLSGHTMSLEHEQSLLQLAASSYPGDPVLDDFQPLGITPLHWENTTLQVLYLLAETVSAQADLSPDEITIHGVTINNLAWQRRLRALKSTLPPHVSVSTDTLFVDPRVNSSEVCGRAFAAFELGSINFEESSASFRSSAYPRLDRVIALANTCNNGWLSITGHSDSSGNAAWNQRLSLQRANAVGDYIVRGGVARERLRVTGVGSSTPIADDSTRYGRSLNRRIEIALTDAD